MLIVTVHRLTADDVQEASYECAVKVTTSPTQLKTIAVSSLRHKRGKGWRELLRRIADEAIEV